MNALSLTSLMKLGLAALWSDIRYSIYWHTKLILTCLLGMVLALVLFITWNVQQTKYTVVTVVTDTETTYHHSHDQRTSGIVNYLTGRGPLPVSERLPLYRQYIKNRMEEAQLAVPEHFESFTIEEVNAVAVQWYKHKYPNHPKDPDTIQQLLDELFINAVQPPLEGFTDNVHDNLWRLLEAVGSPRIRWVEEQDDDFSRFIVAYAESDKQAFYNPVNHTIYITYDNAVSVLLHEVGHSKQFRENPYQSHFRMVGSMLTAWVGGNFDFSAAKDVYQTRYHHPNTFEGEAHGPIKDELLKEFGLLAVDEHAPEKT